MGKMMSSVSTYDNHLKAIGLITVNFALLQSQIEFAIKFLLGTDQRVGQIITAELSFKNLLALFSSLYRFRTQDAKAIEKLKRLIKKIDQAEKKRNTVIHSLWAGSNTQEAIVRFKTTAKVSRGLTNQFEEVSVDYLNMIADEIAEVTDEIIRLLITK